MPYTVEIPGGRGTVEFPDDVSFDEAQKEIEKQFPPNGAEIAERLAAEPDYQPTTEEFQLYKEYAKEKQTSFIDSFAQGVDYMLGVAGRGIAAGVTEGAALNPANYLEAMGQGTQQLYGMIAQSQDPNSALFKLKDLINGTGTVESQRQQFIEARKFNQDLAKYESGESTFLPKEMVNPEYVQAAAMILDPTLALPGLGEVFGAGKLATKGVGLAARGVGRGVSALARPVETATKAGERILAEAINVTPEGLATAARTTGVASALGVAPAVGVVGAVPLIATTAREAGEALATAGENLLTQPSRIGPLEAIGRIPGANLRQRTLGVIGQYGGDAALDTALRATAGSIEGGAIGAGLGYLGGGEEGAGFGAGSGATMGAAGTAAARGYQKLTGKAAREARQGDFDRYVATQDENTAGLLRQIESQHGLDVASGFMDATALVRGQLGDVNVTLLSAEDYRKRFGTNSRGVQIPEADTPAIYVNADLFGQGKGDSPLYTLGHEVFHALERSEQLASRASEIKDALVGSYVVTDGVATKVTNGLFDDAEVEARFNQYRDKLAPQQAEALAQYDTPQKRADFVASEIAAEYTGALFAGQKPDALLRGFSGLTRTLLDQALTKNADSALNRIAQRIENTFGLKPLDSILFPDLKQASPQVNAMLRDLVRARRKLDERILAADNDVTGAIKPTDMGNPIAAKVAQDFGIAEQNPDGTTRWLTDEEINAREWRDNQAVQDILLTRPGARLVDGVIQGRFSPEQLSAIEQSQQVSSRMKDKIRAVAASINNGNSIFIDYNAATRRVKNKITGNYTSKYSSGIRMTQRELLPYAFYFSKADNPVIKAIDLTKIRRAVERSIQPDKSIAGIWENMDGFMSDLAKYFTNLDSPRRQPSAVALDSDAKAKFIGDLVNEAEKGGRKFVRDFRLDRMGAVSPRNFTARISEEAIQFSKQRWMPAEQVGDTSVTSSEEGYRIVSKDKNRLYGPDGKLIGIYDTQLEAERKADATQARVQSEIDQQQRLPGDEGRQTAEAGGGDRPVSSTQGREEGGQELGPVRQAGDVTKTDGLAILDGELKLDFKKRPTVMEIATALQDRFGEPIDWEKSTPAQNKVLRDAVVQEAVRAVGLHPEAKGWYDENIKLTVDILKELDPDIAKPENDFIFKILLAATSDGNKVRPQFLQSWDEYTNWKNTGKISGQFVSGDRVGNIRKNLYKVEAMIQAVGWEKVRDFLTKKGTVTEIREALVRDFGFTKKEAADVGKSELADEVVPYAIVLGPKLGSFFNNLYGDFSSVTMDRWFMRTMGRLTGTQVDTSAFTKIRSLRAELRKSISNLTPSEKEFLKISSDKIKGDKIDAAAKSISTRFSKKETRDRATQLASEGRPFMEEVRKRSNALKKIQSPLVEAPLNGRHRRWIRNRIAEVQAELKSKGIELENADLQAVLWYLEKELYDKLNYRAKPGDSDYASAAANLYERVVGRPSSVYAGSSGRIRSVGGGGRDVAVGAANPAEASAAVAGARLMPSESPEQGFYSKLERVIDSEIKGSSIPADQLKAILRNRGVKAEELKWSSVDFFIDQLAEYYGGKVPKYELLRKLRHTRPNFGVMEGEPQWVYNDESGTYRFDTKDEAEAYRDNSIDNLESIYSDGWSVEEIPEEEGGGFRVVDEYDNPARPVKSDSGREVWRFDDSYDTEDKARIAIVDGARYAAEALTPDIYQEAIQPDFEEWSLPGGTNYREIAFAGTSIKPWTGAGQHDFEALGGSNAVGNAARIGHMRVDDRSDATGKQGLFIQEFQSDRHQQGREKGYGAEGIPDAPFRKDWPVQLFKRALKDAVDRGMKWIGWTDGDTQAQRFDLSQQVEYIDYRRIGSDKYDVAVVGKNGNELFSETGINQIRVSDVVGKEIADKMAKGEGQSGGGRMTLRGLDLKIGGEGMKAFYDKILPNEIGKYVKQWGAKVEKDQLKFKTIPFWKIAITPEMANAVRQGQERYMPAPVPDPSIPGAYSMSGFRVLPGKTKGRVRVYSPTGGLLGIASSNDEAQRMIQRKLR